MTRSTIPIQSILGALVVAVVGVSLWAPVEVDARAPTTSALVENVQPTLEPSFLTDGATVYVGINECERLISENRDFQVTFRTNVNIETIETFDGAFYYRDERGGGARLACPDESGCNDIPEDDIVRDNRNIELTVPIRDLLGRNNVAVCEEGELDKSLYTQVRIREAAAIGAEWRRPEARVVFDLVRPEAPTLTDAFATEFSISVEFEGSTSLDVERHAVIFSSESFDGGVTPAQATSRTPRVVEGDVDVDSGRVTVELEGGSTVWVAVAARDKAGNYSLVSDPMEVAVTSTINFWDVYRDGGGSEEGGHGCQVAGGDAPFGSLVWWLAALAMIAAWWRGQKTSTARIAVRSSQGKRKRR